MSEPLRQLLNAYQLAEGDCNGAISDIHLQEISQSYCRKWKSLAPHLEMKDIEVDDIDHSNGDEQEKRHALLKKWKAGKGSDATYKQLISALLAIGCREEAEGVCELLQKSLPQESLASESTTPASHSERIAGEKTEKCSAITPHGLRGDDVVEKDIKSLHDEFKSLISNIKCQLISKGERTGDLHEKLVHLPQPLQRVYGTCLKENYCCLDTCEQLNHKRFFSVLHNCWNFIDSDLLEYIIKEYGNEKVTRAMHVYCGKIRKFYKTTTVHQLVVIMAPIYKASEIPQDYIKCVATLDRDPKMCTLQDLELLRKDIKNSLGHLPLSKTCVAMYLCDMKTGSVIVVWLVPTEAVNIQAPAHAVLSRYIYQHMDIIVRHRIEFLSLDDYIIYPVEEHFWNVCRDGNSNYARELLDADRNDPNLTCKELELSVLMCAAKHGHLDLMKLLVESEAKVDAVNEAGCTALTISAQANRTHGSAVTQYLLREGADPYKETANGQTPLLLAIENGNIEILRALLDKDFGVKVETDVEGTAIRAAVEKGNVDIVRCLLKAFPEAARDMSEEMMRIAESEEGQENEESQNDVEGASAVEEFEEEASQEKVVTRGLSLVAKVVRYFQSNVMSAAKSGDHMKVEQLLKKKGADPNITKKIDMLQWTPLIWACHRGHIETVKVLLKYGADPNIAATNGFTALILACRKGNHEIVELLLDPSNPKAARVNERNKTRGWSALMWTAQTYAGRLGNKQRFTTEQAKENRRKVAEILLKKGAEVNLEADNGWTPLMQASQDGDVKMVEILCKAATKEEINHQSQSTWSALTTACRRNHEDIARVLVEHGADVNQGKNGGVTALHIASYKNMINTVEMMLTTPGTEAQVDIQDEWGMTPLILAAKKQHQELMQYLVVNANADVNIRAEKYAQWSAIFFAIKGGDRKTVDFLLDHNADTDLTDKCNHTPLSYSKKKGNMHKHLMKRLLEEDATHTSHGGATPTPTSGEAHSEKAYYTPIDGTIYTGVEMRWRTTQLPNMILNI